MDPLHNGYPHHLFKLDELEDMLIEKSYPIMKPYRLQNIIIRSVFCHLLIKRSHPVMKTYRLQNITISYEGNVVNIKQDIQGLSEDKVNVVEEEGLEISSENVGSCNKQ
eukprot:2359452-Ditylum_brightwellii.AAC.1